MMSVVTVRSLRLVPDDRGYLMEILRADDPEFAAFGQVYVTTVYPGIVKGWHYHKLQTDLLTVVAGNAKIVLFDDRADSPTRGEVREFWVGYLNPVLIRVPPRVLHGFMACGGQPAMLLNIPDLPYNRLNPDECRVKPDDPAIPYDWRVKNG
jgi:dTDP-4-dehydrorhamnose 3,5-epimerase